MHQLRLFEMRLGSPPSTTGDEAADEHVRLAGRACARRARLSRSSVSRPPHVRRRRQSAIGTGEPTGWHHAVTAGFCSGAALLFCQIDKSRSI
jgi:hypothetical protein